MDTDHDAIFQKMHDAQERGRTGQPVTADAIAADQWNAVYMPLPADASRELLIAAHDAAGRCYDEAGRAEQTVYEPGAKFETHAAELAREGVSPDAHEFFEGHRHAAGDRCTEITDRLRDSREGTPTGAEWIAASRASTATAANERGRDLADVTAGLEKLAGMDGSPEQRAFKQSQADMGDQIARERDPEKRAALRTEREAQAHDYAAGAADRAGRGLDALGHREDSAHMKELASLHREIAGEFRNPTPPEKGTDRAEGRDDFSRAAEGASGLGPTARTVHVSERPARVYAELKGDSARAAEEGPTPQRPQNAPNRAVIVGAGQGGAELMEIHRARPDVLRASNDTEAREAAARYARSDATGKEQQATQRAASGEANATPRSPADERLAMRAAEVRAIKESLERDDAGDGASRPGKDTKTAFRSAARSP